MKYPWKAWLYVVLTCSPCQGSGEVLTGPSVHPPREIAAQRAEAPGTVSVSPCEISRLSHDLVAQISFYLNPADHSHLKETAKLFYTTLGSAPIERQQLGCWGVKIISKDGRLNAADALVLSASSTLKSLWDAGRYLDIAKMREEIAHEVFMQSLVFDLDSWQRQLLLTQAILLGNNAAPKQLEHLLGRVDLAHAFDVIAQLYESDTAWLKRPCIDILFQSVWEAKPGARDYLLSGKGAGLLQRLCRAGTFLVLADIKFALQEGEWGFDRNTHLSTMLAVYLAQPKGLDEWCMIVPKKKHVFRKITLQELLPGIMTAISEREFE